MSEEAPRPREVNVPPRIAELDRLNRESWYMTDERQAFHVDISVNTAGKPRQMANQYHPEDKDLVEAARIANRVIRYPLPGRRFPLAGNMSTAIDRRGGKNEPYGPKDLPPEQRLQDARNNMDRHLDLIGIDPATIRVLHPDQEGSAGFHVVDVDHDTAVYDGVEPAKLNGQGDMIYTYNPNIVFGVRPADCPLVVISAETPKGRIYIMIHFAWREAANGEMEEVVRELVALGVDLRLPTTKVYVTPGGQAETFPFENASENPNEQYPQAEGLFADVKSYEEDGETKYKFMIDTPNFVYQSLLDMGIDPHQIFLDSSDTTAPESGHASHSRAMRLDDDNTRDIVTVKFEKPESVIASNPDRPTPPEVEWRIVPLDVEYIDFDGDLQQGTIEVNRDVYDDVKAFFEKALELKYPIEKVVKSSDPEYLWDDDKLMAANTSSGFNYRLIKDTDRPSLHGLGLAFDVNTRLNPLIRHKDGATAVDPPDGVYDPSLPGVLTSDHPLVLFMKERGWEWGGDWRDDVDENGNWRIDYQHFQKKPPEAVN